MANGVDDVFFTCRFKNCEVFRRRIIFAVLKLFDFSESAQH